MAPGEHPGRDSESENDEDARAPGHGKCLRDGAGAVKDVSIPPHLVAKAAARLGPAAFDDVHRRLLHAYFAENRDITDADTLAAIWREAGLPPSEFARAGDPELLRVTIDQHDAAIRCGVTGVPAVLLVGTDVPITGALPLESYRRWIARALTAAPE
jgi:putative protein-disulfide isomerase